MYLILVGNLGDFLRPPMERYVITHPKAWFESDFYFLIGYEVVWWGNTVTTNGCDGKACSYLEVPDTGFGPAPGEFH